MEIDTRQTAEARWLELTREALPEAARRRGWPVQADHCFQRIFLDHACKGVWYDHIQGRPAYAHAERHYLDRAIALAEAVLTGEADLATLNRQSLTWRKTHALSLPANLFGTQPELQFSRD
jgi:hypothetical protein